MDCKRKTIPKAIVWLLSFLIPAIIFFVAAEELRFEPFGNKSILISDSNALYVNYMGYVREVLHGNAGILFSFEKGMGENMMGSWAWFLLNPLFVVFSFFEPVNFQTAMVVMTCLSVGISGPPMFWLLCDLYGYRKSHLIFSTTYALNGFIAANIFNINFFAAIPVLPIVALGIKRIIEDRSPALYTLSLAYILFCNFYFGFIICVASVVMFLTELVPNWKWHAEHKSVALKYAISSVFAGGISSLVWLPGIMAFRNGRLKQGVYFKATENFQTFDVFSKMFAGANSGNELKAGLPNIYIGLLPVFLVVLFFLSKRISRKKKKVAGAVLAFYLLTFHMPVLDRLMHGWSVTNWFNFRDSFVFIFFALIIAADEWQYVQKEPDKEIHRAILIIAAITGLTFTKKFEFVSSNMAIIEIGILIFTVHLIRTELLKKRDSQWSWEPAANLMGIVCVCLGVNLILCTSRIQPPDGTQAKFREVTGAVSTLVNEVKETDQSEFYRMEVQEQRSQSSGNDPMLFSYYGIGHSGSDQNNSIQTAISKLGFHHFDMRVAYSSNVPISSDALVGLKYIISNSDIAAEKGYEKLQTIRNWSVYQNPNAFPLIFLGNRIDVSNAPLSNNNVFAAVNEAYDNMINPNILSNHPFDEINDLSFKVANAGDDLVINRTEAIGEAKTLNKIQEEYENGSHADEIEVSIQTEKPIAQPAIEFTCKAIFDGPAYAYNGYITNEAEQARMLNLCYLGQYKKGDLIKGYIVGFETYDESLGDDRIQLSKEVLVKTAAGFRVAQEHTDVAMQASDALNDQDLEFNRLSDSHIVGRFSAKEGQSLMTTIPHEDGWKLYVDGLETDIKTVSDVFVGANMPEGSHEFELKFEPPGLKVGALISVVSLMSWLAYCGLGKFRKQKQIANSRK